MWCHMLLMYDLWWLIYVHLVLIWWLNLRSLAVGLIPSVGLGGIHSGN